MGHLLCKEVYNHTVVCPVHYLKWGKGCMSPHRAIQSPLLQPTGYSCSKQDTMGAQQRRHVPLKEMCLALSFEAMAGWVAICSMLWMATVFSSGLGRCETAPFRFTNISFLLMYFEAVQQKSSCLPNS